MLVPIGAAVAVLAAIIVVGIILQSHDTIERPAQDQAVATALAATGFTPPPTAVPGSDLQLDVVLINPHDYLPIRTGEQINLILVNARQKSVYVSNCDGVVLERFTGSDVKDNQQTKDDRNWRPIAPGGYRFCGPTAGRLAKQIEPGVRADATFKFDRSQTKPYNGESWDVPGTYRLRVNYFLNCPDASLKAEDCIDARSYTSNNFQIIAPPPGYTPPPPTTPTAKP